MQSFALCQRNWRRSDKTHLGKGMLQLGTGGVGRHRPPGRDDGLRAGAERRHRPRPQSPGKHREVLPIAPPMLTARAGKVDGGEGVWWVRLMVCGSWGTDGMELRNFNVRLVGDFD